MSINDVEARVKERDEDFVKKVNKPPIVYGSGSQSMERVPSGYVRNLEGYARFSSV